jgi:serine/threonine protein kinase
MSEPVKVAANRVLYSSAKDMLTGQSVAVKKIMKPFSTPVLSKRTYRELKLLKHLRHENVQRSDFREAAQANIQ